MVTMAAEVVKNSKKPHKKKASKKAAPKKAAPKKAAAKKLGQVSYQYPNYAVSQVQQPTYTINPYVGQQ